MRKLRCILLLALCLMAAGAARAQKAEAQLIGPERAVVEGQKFMIVVRLTNAELAGSLQPMDVPNCTFIYGPQTQSVSSYQIVNGKASSMSYVDVKFTYKADKEGTVSVPAQTVPVKGQKLKTNAITFKILPGGQAGGGQAGQQPAPKVYDYDDIDSKDVASSIGNDDMFIRVILDKQSVYEQEAVVATMKIYTTYGISSFRSLALPTYDGFFSEDIPVSSKTDYEHYNGKNYATAVLRKCVLYPQKPGKLTINSGEFELTLNVPRTVRTGPFIDTRYVEVPVKAKTNSATLDVKPLPSPKPAGFGGAVGSFKATAEMSPLELRANEVSQYTYVISGTGNVKFLKAPTLSLPVGVDKLTPKTDIQASFTGSNLSGSFTITYPLIPQNPGKVQIPSQPFAYFNPADGEYHTIELPAFELSVAKGANVATGVEQTSIAKGMTDILHIKPVGSLSRTPSFVFRTAGYWLLYVLSTLAFCAILYAYRRRMRLQADVTGRKMAKANRQAAKRLKQARAMMAKRDTERFYQELNQAMAGYLSDKLNIPVSGLVRDNIAAQLAEYGAPRQAIDDAISILDECEMARFASAGTDSEMSALLQKAEETIKAIERKK